MAKSSTTRVIVAAATTVAGLCATIAPFKYTPYFDHHAFQAISLVFVGCTTTGLGLSLPWKRPILGAAFGLTAAIAIMAVLAMSPMPH